MAIAIGAVAVVFLNKRDVDTTATTAPTGVHIVQGLPGSADEQSQYLRSTLGLPPEAAVHAEIASCLEKVLPFNAENLTGNAPTMMITCPRLYRQKACGAAFSADPEAPDGEAPDPRMHVLRTCQAAYCERMPHSDGSCTAPPKTWSEQTAQQWTGLHTHILLGDLQPAPEERASVEAFAYLSSGLLHASVITATLE